MHESITGLVALVQQTNVTILKSHAAHTCTMHVVHAWHKEALQVCQHPSRHCLPAGNDCSRKTAETTTHSWQAGFLARALAGLSPARFGLFLLRHDGSCP
jgi:hypothetical protein